MKILLWGGAAKSESAPTARTRTMPAGHGGAEGKRCEYFVDERYLASLGLMALKISSRIPNAAKGIYDSGVYLVEFSKIIGWKKIISDHRLNLTDIF